MTVIRLSVVTETYLPDVNGVANSLAQMLSALDPDKFRIQIIRTKPRTDWTSQFEEVWCPGVSIPMYPDLQLGWPAKKSIQDAWQRFQPDIVFLVTEGPLSYSALRLAQKMGMPAVSAFHTNFHRYSAYYGLGWIKSLTLRWLRYFHNQTRRTLVPAQEVADSLTGENFERIEVLPHGVDCERFNPKRRSIALRNQWQADDNPVCLYVGRVAAEKNIPLALKAYQQLKVDNPDLLMVVVGDGPMRASLQQEYPDVIFAGIKTGTELARYYASADYFIFPSLTETYGLVTTEALASGLPVAAFNVAAAAMHIEPGVNGALAVENNEQDFIYQCQQMMAVHQPMMRQQARQVAEHISWQSVAEQFANVLRSELKSKTRQEFSLPSENS